MAAGKILVVDDNRRIHQDFRKILEPRSSSDKLALIEVDLFRAPPPRRKGPDFEIVSAHQGQEGLRLVEQAIEAGEPYQVAFVDVRMPPGWDGIETVRRIWRVDPNVQVVLCTAYSDYSWEKTIEALGSVDRFLILKKPFDAIEVQQLAHSLTEKWRLRQAQAKDLAALTDQVQRHHTVLNAALEARAQFSDALERAQKMEAVGELAAGVAHEINTPVQFVGDSLYFIEDAGASMGEALNRYADLVARAHQLTPEQLKQAENDIREDADLDFLQSELPDAISRARTGVDRVIEIVQTLREYSHPGNNVAVSVDLSRAIRNALVVTRNQYKYVAELKSQCSTGLRVVCVPGDLDQILMNLIVNAAHAITDARSDSDPLGTLRISAQVEEHWGVVRIADTGVGIATDIRDHVFEPFFTTKENGRGTGQGLAIVKRLVERNGGQIGFESRVGLGTTFSLRVPLGQSNA